MNNPIDQETYGTIRSVDVTAMYGYSLFRPTDLRTLIPIQLVSSYTLASFPSTDCVGIWCYSLVGILGIDRLLSGFSNGSSLGFFVFIPVGRGPVVILHLVPCIDKALFGELETPVDSIISEFKVFGITNMVALFESLVVKLFPGRTSLIGVGNDFKQVIQVPAVVGDLGHQRHRIGMESSVGWMGNIGIGCSL